MLIGGQSRRMGEPKALLRLAPTMPTLLETVAGTLQRIAADLCLVGQASWPMPASLAGLRRVDDGGNGAADGVIAALHAARFDVCVVVGCDMPFLDTPLLGRMVRFARQAETGAIARDASGLHPMHAVWHRRDLDRIEQLVASGERSLTVIAHSLEMAAIDVDADDDTTRWSVFNVNTPDDLTTARSHARMT